jgi:hypothetical protein
MWDRESDPSIALALTMMWLGGLLLLAVVLIVLALVFVF